MKKLIVLFAVTALGLSVTAASMDWNMTVASTAKGYQTMFFDYADLAAIQGILDAGGTGTTVLDALKGYAIGNASGTQTFATGSKSTSLSSQLFSGVDKGTDMFAVVFDTKSTAAIIDEMTYGISGKFSTSSYIYDGNADPPESSPGTFSFGLASGLTAGTIGGGSTPSEDVPEPTSGLLLVLGGAMLALRRRRA